MSLGTVVSWKKGAEDRGSKRDGAVCARRVGAGKVPGTGTVMRVSYWGDSAGDTLLIPCVCMGMCVCVHVCSICKYSALQTANTPSLESFSDDTCGVQNILPGNQQ